MVVIFSLLVSSCDILSVIDIDFTTDAQKVRVAIAPTDAGNISKTYDDLDSDINKEIEKHGGIIDNLESVVISSVKINLVSGANNFNVLKNAEISFATPEMTEKKVAWIDNIPTDTTVVFPQHTGDNLKDYLDDEQYQITLSSEVIESFTDTIFIDIVIAYDVTL